MFIINKGLVIVSYSRWSNSRWYTFYCASPTPFKDDQYFDVCGVMCFTYKQIKENIEGCLDGAVKQENENCTQKVTPEQRKELKGYMLRFMKHVENSKECILAEKIRDCPEDELPLLISELHTDPLRELLERRLKGEKLENYSGTPQQYWKEN